MDIFALFFLHADGKFKLISGGKYSVDTKVFTKSTDVHWFGKRAFLVILI